ncbi:DNAj domain protein [Pseudogymnoascus destructans]|uniref:DNAj domain protein n=1 Tax=Pseudogymnoascus destructans TaxID=655981 RepID=A0A176ZYE0_9PEZI|nr:DNAj domain protein [Pseudogymnoascus destructans]OAF54926.2 DNAj domain protein [Pseudogymnoascus destructans]
MPYRSLPPLIPSCRRFLHHSAVLHATHYETLRIQTTASAKEIKTAFYHLSKLSHPDRNPTDPTASTRFVHISEAYATLRSPEKRQRYDRDLGLHHHHPHPSHAIHPAAAPAQSHYGPAGGRAPSGLSRRRATFRGAPASFYRSGGWGEHSAKRRAAQENSSGTTGGEARPKTEGGMGWGQSAWVAAEEARHFDRGSHLRTFRNHERRMKGRAAAAAGKGEEGRGRGMLRDFLIVSGLVFVGIAAPWWVPGLWGRGDKRKEGV